MISEVEKLMADARKMALENVGILDRYSMEEVSNIYNGIGPDRFPEWLRKTLDKLHPSLRVVALIHDLEYHEGGTRDEFTESNERFYRNGKTVAFAKYAWYDPRRYIVMNQARRFGNICQKFGWKAWTSPCECAVCEKKRRKEKKENA